MIRLYDFPLSGNAHKVRNMLSLLAVPYERVLVDLPAGEQRSPEFLALNPFGQVPVLRDDDETVRDSSAILVYLGRKFGRGEWLPVDALGEARVVEWLATANTLVADGLARARVIQLFGRDGDLGAAQELAHRALGSFDAHLDQRAWLACKRPTIADVANYSYVALAPDGGVALDPYPNVQRWLERLEKLPGFEPAPSQAGGPGR